MKYLAFAYGGIGFMNHTNRVFNKYNMEFAQLVREYYYMLYELHDFMVHTIRQCEQSVNQLQSIETKLNASNQNMRFIQQDMLEVVTICAELKNTFDTFAERNGYHRRCWILYSKKIDIFLTRFQESRCAYWVKYSLFGIAEGGIFLNTVFNNIILSVFCGFLGAQLAMYCTSYVKFSVKLILTKLEERTEETSLKLSNYRNQFDLMIVYCVRYQESADSNILGSLASVARVTAQTTKMVDETAVMQMKLQELINELRKTAVKISRIIISESVDNILVLSGTNQSNE